MTIGQDKNQPFINVYCLDGRYRFWNGKAIGVDLKCIDNPSLLKAAFELKLREGWKPQPKTKGAKEQVLTVMQALEQGAENKAAQGCSARFIKDTRRVITLWRRYEAEHSIRNLTLEELKPVHIRAFLVRPNWSPKTQRTVKSTIGTLLSDCKPGSSNASSSKNQAPRFINHSMISKAYCTISRTTTLTCICAVSSPTAAFCDLIARLESCDGVTSRMTIASSTCRDVGTSRGATESFRYQAMSKTYWCRANQETTYSL